MKKILHIVIFFLLLFLFAKWGPAIPLSTVTQTKGEPLIVEGTGKSFVTPDIAKISVGIEEDGQNLKQVQNSVNQKSKTLTDALKGLGINEKDIKTTSYNLYPEFDYNQPTQKVIGYKVSINYEVTINDFDKVNEALVIVTSSGANIVGGISYEVNEKTKKEKLQEAREMAVTEAKDKAQGLASAAGVSLGKVLNISEAQGVEVGPYPVMERAIGKPDDIEVIEPGITPGETELSVTIFLSYEIR